MTRQSESSLYYCKPRATAAGTLLATWRHQATAVHRDFENILSKSGRHISRSSPRLPSDERATYRPALVLDTPMMGHHIFVVIDMMLNDSPCHVCIRETIVIKLSESTFHFCLLLNWVVGIAPNRPDQDFRIKSSKRIAAFSQQT